MPGFWKAPRALARMLAARELTPNEYTLIHVAAEWNADRPGGFVTTIEFLADSLGVSERTVYRVLRSLRANGLIRYDDHPGVAIFAIRTTAALAALVSEPVSEAVSEPVSDPVSEVDPKNLGHPSTGNSRKPASVNASGAVQPRTPSRGPGDTEIENEIETENPPNPPEGGTAGEATEGQPEPTNRRRRRDRRTNAEVIADAVARAERDEDRREAR